jgi:hypothetical protein
MRPSILEEIRNHQWTRHALSVGQLCMFVFLNSDASCAQGFSSVSPWLVCSLCVLCSLADWTGQIAYSILFMLSVRYDGTIYI